MYYSSEIYNFSLLLQRLVRSVRDLRHV